MVQARIRPARPARAWARRIIAPGARPCDRGAPGPCADAAARWRIDPRRRPGAGRGAKGGHRGTPPCLTGRNPTLDDHNISVRALRAALV